MINIYKLDLTENQRKQIGKWLGIFILLAYLLSKSLIILIIAGLGLIGSQLINKSMYHKLLAFITPFIMSLLIGWGVAYSVYFIQDFGSKVMGKPVPQAIVWQSWYDSPFKPLNNPANKAARGGVVAGAVIGFIFIYMQRKPKVWHGPGYVRGEKVTKGGWADLPHLTDKCDFGPPKRNAGNIPLGYLQNNIVRVNHLKGKVKMAGHALIVGATGIGKSFTLIRNMIIAAACDGDSIVVTDPKGELFEDMAKWLKERDYEVIPFNVIDPAHGYWWNQLLECRNFDEIKDLADWMISAAGDDHSFFSGGEKNVLAAVFAYCKWVLPRSQAHAFSALSVLTWPQEFLDLSFNAAYQNRLHNGLPEEAYETWKGVQGKFQNYIEGVRNKLRDTTKGSMAALTSKSDFALDAVGKKKTAIFLILPTEDVELKSLLVPFYGFMFRRLNELASTSPKGKLPIGVRFILDELGNIGRIPDLDRATALGRSKGIMVQMTVQNIGQLQGLYSRNKLWEAIAGNCPIKLCLGLDDINSATYFTKMMGGAEVKHVSESKDITKPMGNIGLPKRRESLKNVKIMEPWELLQLPEDDCIAVLRGKRPLYLQKLPWIDLPQYKEIKKAGTCTPADWVPTRSFTIDKPPYPVLAEHDIEESPGKAKTVKLNKPEIAVETDRIADEYF